MKNILLRYLNLRKIKNYAFDHKIISFVFLLILIFCAYKIYGYFTDTSGQARYVIEAVQTGTIISTVTGSGQVSASSQVEVQAKASGDIVYIGVKSGQTVKAGTLLAQIDSRSAALDLENVRIALAKLTEPADKLDLLQAQNALKDAEEAKTKAYADSLNSIDETFVHLLGIMTGLDLLLKDSQISSPYFSHTALFNRRDDLIFALAYREAAIKSYDKARTAYDANLKVQQEINRGSADDSIKNLTVQTYQTAKLAAQALKDANTAVSYVVDQTESQYRTNEMTTDLDDLSTWISQMTADVASLNSLSATLGSVDRTIADKTEALNDLVNGPDTLDVQAQELAVRQKELSYSNYFVRAPFDGVVAKVNVDKADTVGSGSTVAIIITNKKIAAITLNEVDAVRVKAGQKVTLTFDAVPDLNITGEVSEVDLVGTIDQGVVNYEVKIAFDTQDSRIKSGMSANASIVTDLKPDVLIVPNAAIKIQNNSHYVETVDKKISTTSQGVTLSAASIKKPVEIGVADDLNTEIISGLQEGEKIITRTINGNSSAKTTSQTPSLFGGSGRSGGIPR